MEVQMTQKHISDIDQVARDIYNYAANHITAFLQQEYGSQQGDTLGQQMEDFHLIAERASVYLMGNVLAIMDESAQEESIAVQNQHLRKMIIMLRGMTAPTNGILN